MGGSSILSTQLLSTEKPQEAERDVGGHVDVIYCTTLTSTMKKNECHSLRKYLLSAQQMTGVAETDKSPWSSCFHATDKKAISKDNLCPKVTNGKGGNTTVMK